jgi:prepilin-type N-terminal cleavage/methylation domain-containing protein
VHRCRAGVRGFSLIELLSVVGAMAIVLAVAMPHASNDRFALWQAQTQVISDLRRARTDALTKGNHFTFKVLSSTTYAEYRLTLNAGVWQQLTAAVRSGTLPSPVQFNTGVGSTFEFDTRGLMVLPSAALTATLQDTHSSKTRNVTVWPSGQVAPL